MSKLDWILFCFGASGWIVAWATTGFYAKAFHYLCDEAIEMLKEQREAVLESLRRPD